MSTGIWSFPEGELSLEGNILIIRYGGTIIRQTIGRYLYPRLINNELLISLNSPVKRHASGIKSLLSRLNSLSTGLLDNYRWVCKFLFTYFPMNVAIQRDRLVINNFLGMKDTLSFRIPPQLSFTSITSNTLELRSYDRMAAMNFVSNIKYNLRRLKKKDERVFQDNLVVS